MGDPKPLGVSTGLVSLFEAPVGVFFATALRLPISPILESRAPYAFYFPVVAWCSWRGGWRAGSVAALLSGIAGTFFFVRPTFGFGVLDTSDGAAIAVYAIASAALVLLGENGHRSAEQRDRARKELLTLNRELERLVEERTAAAVARNEQLEGFTHTVAHDLRTPIRGIVNAARMLEEDEADRLSVDGTHRLRRIRESALHLGALVDDLLQYARSGQRELRRQSVNLVEIFQEELALVRTELPDAELNVVVPTRIEANGDPALIAIVLRNFISNAIKYRRLDRPTRVELGVTDQSAFYVRDNGIGFSMEFAVKVFEPFERLHRRDEYPGTGIGLANVRRIIERHGGQVWAESSAEAGSTFFFTLR